MKPDKITFWWPKINRNILMKTYGGFVTKVFQKVLSKTPVADEPDWMGTLPRNDSLASLEIINRHLAALVHTEEPADETRIHALLSIDERCHDIVANIEYQYSTILKLNPEIDRRMWDSLQTFRHYITQGYLAFINDYSEHSDYAIQHSQQLPLIAIRTLNCIYQTAKFRYFRYQSVIAEDWIRMHKLYRVAEREGFADKPVEMYPELPEYSFSEKYVLALMMDMLNHSNMTKKQIDRVEAWLSCWLKGVVIEGDFDEQRFLFYTNLDKSRGGSRIRNFTPEPSCRYWETDKMVALIGKAKRFLNEGRSVEEFGLLESDRSQDCIDILEYLHSEWSRTEYNRQRREEERNSVMRTAAVVHGFQLILQLVRNFSVGKPKGSGYGVAMTLEEIAAANTIARHAPLVLFPEMAGERWTLSDESEKGFGAIVGQEVINSVKLGTLIALVCEDQRDALNLGVIRSIKDIDNRLAHIGIEVFSRAPMLMELASTTTPDTERHYTGDVYLDSTLLVSPFAVLQTLYLPPDATLGTRASMIVPSINFDPEGIFTLKVGHKMFTVQYGAIIEQKDDWIRAYVIVNASTA